MKYCLIFIMLLSSCTIDQEDKGINLNNLNFTDNLTIKEFKSQLEQYAINKPYPDINN